MARSSRVLRQPRDRERCRVRSVQPGDQAGDAIKDPAAWIWSVSFKTAAGELQRRAMSEPLGERDRGYEHPDPMPHVFAALRRLPPRQRAVVVLHDYADRPTDEIARTLGMRRPTVHVHLSQGRKRLRLMLEQGDE